MSSWKNWSVYGLPSCWIMLSLMEQIDISIEGDGTLGSVTFCGSFWRRGCLVGRVAVYLQAYKARFL